MYIYFDTNGTIKEIVNDKSIRQGSTEANKIYCYIEGNPTIDDIWYMQKLPSGETSNEVSFKNSTITKAIPYDAKRDMRYFKDFEQYTFYVFTLNSFLVSQKGLNLATIRIVVDNEIFALGELTFNVQENVINVDNGITISQYDYLLLAYASRTLNEVTANDLDALLDDKINAKIGDLANGSPKVFDTEANIEAMHDDEGIAVATDTGYIYVWNDTQQEYISTGLLYVGDISLYYTKTETDTLLNTKANASDVYTKTESDNRYAQLGADNIFTGDNDFRGDSLFSDDINQASGDFSSQGNVEAHSFTKQGTNLDDIYASKSDTYTKAEVYNKTETDNLLDLKADKSTTYTKTESDALLNAKADKTNTYTKAEINTALNDKVNTSDFDTLDGRVDDIEDDIDTLKSVQNVVDIVATYSALQSYDTSDLGTNDKIQVIADETHSGASTIYNWNGSAWVYVGAYGTNSYTKSETLEQIDLHKLVNKTYSELATLKSNNQLVAGQLYRITDYVTKTNGLCNGISNDVRSMEHPFDIVLRAISSNKFSENARALLHSGDTYFANSNLNSWQLWYCFDNDDIRFEWADTLTGKGVIYRMIDEFGNDLPYDFKNIQFKRYKITATTDARHSNAIGKYLGFSGNYNCTSDNTDYVWYFTFSKRADGTDLSLTQTLANSYTNCYYVKEVKIGEYLSDTPNYRGIQALNNIVFECDNIVVDVQMGVCSNHNTFIGNKDITYVYFKEMCRNNIVYGEMSHARADECFEQNIMGDFVALSQYTLCWNKFSHHFARNIAVQMQSNDFEAQVSDCKFPENFTRNHIFNMWGSVDASTHDTFNRCELGLFSYTTLSGGGTWDGVYGISLDHCTIKIANLFGSKLGRMEYVSISEGVNNYNILNLTVGALFGSSSKVLTIALTDLASYQIASVYEKKIDFANETVNNLRGLIYTWAKYSVAENIVDYGAVRGTISSVDGTVTWTAMDSIYSKMSNMVDGKMNKANPTGTGSISMNSGTASGTNSYANGSGTTASGNYSYANGLGTTASGNYSMAVQGNASGTCATAIGNMANASGNNSKALGEGTRAKGDNQTVIGKFNISDNTSLEIVGCGGYYTEDNARLLDANGNEYLKGDLFIDTTFTKDANKDLVSKNGTSLKQALLNINENLYNESIENGNANSITLSNPQDCGEMVKLGGMSYKCNNLLNLADGENGFIDDSGSVVYRVTQFVSDYIQVFSGKTYIVKTSQNFNNIGVAYYDTSKNISLPRNNNGTVSQVTISPSANGYIRIWFNVDNTTSLTSSIQETYSIMLNEGSTALPYEPYFDGIRNSAVTQITLKDSNNETKSTISIPSAIQNLDGYGWGIDDTCYNYIDFDRKVFVKKVSRINLGTLNYALRDNNIFATWFGDYKYVTGTPALCENYVYKGTTYSYDDIKDTMDNMEMYIYYQSGQPSRVLYFRNTNYSDATSFKNAMNGIYLYYELETPIETDISVYYVNDMLSTSLANNDVVEFVNTYNQKVPFSIKYYNKYQLRDISTLVDKDGNPRFIEGNGVGLSQTGVTITQCKWSLSGTHLMLCVAGTIANGTELLNNSNLATFDVPSYIWNKISPVWLQNIEARTVDMYAQDWTKQQAFIKFMKGTSKLTITCGATMSFTADRNFKIQFDLLIDTD